MVLEKEEFETWGIQHAIKKLSELVRKEKLPPRPG